MPRVSVVMASYNHERFVKEAIQSVLNQSWEDFEIIITDDGSSEETVAKIREINDPRIHLFCFEKNQGACVAMNHCINNANGEYVAVVNSDDVFYEDKLQKQVDFLDNNSKFGAVFGYPLMVDKDGKALKRKRYTTKSIFRQPNRTRHEWLRYFFYNGNCLCHPTVLIRKDCYDDIGLYDPRLAQLPDYDFWIRLCFKYEIFLIPEFLIKFRIFFNGQNASGNSPQKIIRRYNEAPFLYQHYLQIRNERELLSIFPESQSLIKTDPALIPYIISKLALDACNTDPCKQSFAINTLHQIMKDNETVQLLEEYYHFAYSDLIKITGDCDVQNIIYVKEAKKATRHPVKHLLRRILNRR